MSDKEERLYSQKLACVECGTSVPELEPRSFSFNSPYGACEECSGIGSTWAFDPDKIIVDPAKPLLEGALGPGAGIQPRHERGAGSREIAARQTENALGEAAARNAGSPADPHPRDPRRKSTAMRLADYQEWLTEYMSPVPCPACGGKRLRPASLAVRVKNISIAEFTAMPISRALHHRAFLAIDRSREPDRRAASSMKSAAVWSSWNPSGCTI